VRALLCAGRAISLSSAQFVVPTQLVYFSAFPLGNENPKVGRTTHQVMRRFLKTLSVRIAFPERISEDVVVVVVSMSVKDVLLVLTLFWEFRPRFPFNVSST
jgi:hypothetical protein